jgi:hypothetical protein
MRNPDGDVWLRDGKMYMVGTKHYKEHLESALEIKQVAYLHKTIARYLSTYDKLTDIKLLQPSSAKCK